MKLPLFISTAALALTASLGAQAQVVAETSDERPADDTSRVLESVVVIGNRPIAESEEAALAEQRNFPSLVSIISSDAVGRLPDQNIAFAVGRLPGVAIQRDPGQARYVNLRGAPINWTTLSFDGLNVVSPEGRSSRFDNIPSALASQIQARKAVTPDMPGETLAGNINIVTRSPFDYPGFQASAKAGLGIVTLGGGEEIDSSIVLSNTFADGTIGALVSASYYRRNMVTDNFETDWEPVSQDAAQPDAASRPLWAREHENKLYRLTRENTSYSGRLGWQPNETTDVFFSSIYTEYADSELRSNNKVDLDDRQSSTPTTACSARANNGLTVSGGASGYADFCTGNTPLVGTVFGVDFDDNYNDLESVEWIWLNTLGGDHNIAGWDLGWRLNYTQAEDGRDAPALTDYDSPSSRTARPTIDYDFSDPDNHRMEFYQTIQNPDGTYSRGPRILSNEGFQRDLNRLRRRTGGTEGEAWTAKIDIERPFELGGYVVDLKTGLEYSDRTKRDAERLYDINAAGIAAAGLPRTFSAIALDRPYLGALSLGYDFRYHSSSAARGLVDQAIASGQGSFTDSFFYEVTEELLSGYGMGTINTDWGNIILGARVERTENTGIAPFENGFARSSSDNTMVFPSAHVNWDLNQDMKVRFSLNTGAARPEYDDLAPSLTVNDLDETASGGNPNATPEKAYGADAYFEWYLPPRGIFQVGLFHKEVSDVLFNSTTQLGSVVFPDGVDRSDYTLFTIVNGFEGSISGLEIAYQQPAELLVEQLGLPEWLGGFGIQTNATFTESEAEAPDGRTVPLPGTSDVVYNIIPYYEKYGVSMRQSYQFRSDWFSSFAEGGITNANGGDAYWEEDAELDLSVRYSFNENF